MRSSNASTKVKKKKLYINVSINLTPHSGLTVGTRVPFREKRVVFPQDEMMDMP